MLEGILLCLVMMILSKSDSCIAFVSFDLDLTLYFVLQDLIYSLLNLE